MCQDGGRTQFGRGDRRCGMNDQLQQFESFDEDVNETSKYHGVQR